MHVPSLEQHFMSRVRLPYLALISSTSEGLVALCMARVRSRMSSQRLFNIPPSILHSIGAKRLWEV